MEALSNVIVLKTARKVPYNVLREEEPKNRLSTQEEADLTDKARKVLNEMEAAWEIDHGAVELREKFHLLRHYLERLPKTILCK
ncbi:MAG: hypothetical protein NTU90_09440 [Proteobacteria bacterium]|nr:hypothetical protein [Pseudomonadota bacterium]